MTFVQSSEGVVPKIVRQAEEERIEAARQEDLRNEEERRRLAEKEQKRLPIIVAFDLETTGLNPYSADVIEVGAFKLLPDGTVLDTFQNLANPGYPIPHEITRLTGISSLTVVFSSSPIRVVKKFIKWAGVDSTFVAHNASFDVGFLEATYAKAGEDPPTLRVLDTLKWGKRLSIALPNRKLGTFASFLGLDTSDLHRSLADAKVVMHLSLYLARVMDGFRRELYGADFSRMVERNLTGKAHEKIGLETEARILYEENLADGFDGSHPYERLRVIYSRLGSLDDAIRVCRRFLEVTEHAVYSGVDRKREQFERHLERLVQKKAKAQKQ